MYMQDIKKMGKEEIGKNLDQNYVELGRIKEGIRTGKEKDVKKSLKIRKNIARMLTALKDLENNKESEKESK